MSGGVHGLKAADAAQGYFSMRRKQMRDQRLLHMGLMAFGAFDDILAKNKGSARFDRPEDPAAVAQRQNVFDKSCKALSLHQELETLCREAHEKGLYVRPNATELLARPMTPMSTLQYRANYRPPNTAMKTQSALTLQAKLFPIIKQHHH